MADGNSVRVLASNFARSGEEGVNGGGVAEQEVARASVSRKSHAPFTVNSRS